MDRNIVRILDMGSSLIKEKNWDRLLFLILQFSMEIANCDSGALFISREGHFYLKFRIILSKDILEERDERGSSQPFMPIELENVWGYGALKGRLVNIEDVYGENPFDFSDLKEFDKQNGYHTQSMLVVPMEDDRGEAIGVLQLANARDKNGNTISFHSDEERILSCLASQAAASLANINYSRELGELLNSFVRVMSTAIDARTPYNANHTRNMAKYAERFLDFLDREEKGPWFSKGDKKQFIMSVWLHDIGKLVIPLSVMNKDSRLGRARLKEVEHRFAMMGVLNRLAYAEEKLSQAEFLEKESFRKDCLEFLKDCNHAGFLPEPKLERLRELEHYTYTDENGEEKTWLTEEEMECLRIKKGTLTSQERKVMESHVVMTTKFLKEIHFTRDFQKVTDWTGAHHEFMNGKGYPGHLKGEQVEKEVRLLTILDIFESLTAMDRPYKQPMSVEKAFVILEEMVKAGQLDGGLLSLFKESRAWEGAKG